MDNQPKKPVAVVTGVGPGLGASLVRRFAPTYAVAMLARKADYLKALAREIRQGGATVLDLSCDVSHHTQISDAFRAIRKDFGEPEVLLYNAGSGTFGAITEITPEQYEADWRVNAFGAFIAAKEVAPAMIARGRGTMLFTGATAGVKAGPSRSRSDPRSSRCAAWRNHSPATLVRKASTWRGSTWMVASTSLERVD
jgi:NAD(P)-dependent dehydrogenase (short-subunit alcohol dehydrogenase family)